MSSSTQGPEAPVDGRLVADRYRLLTCLGRGGMGVVWEGRDEVLDRAVAVKEVMPPHELTSEQRAHVRERTLREARAAARINSTAAVTVYDVVEEDGRPWIVMQLLPARTLADVLREEGTLSEQTAAELGLRVLDALTAAHLAGVLHRDVKPANVLYDETGQAVLTDFGIASLEGDQSMTTTGTIIGSPGYVAPERALGEPPSPASDLWSLGVTLATAVHGRSPFERDSAMATLVAGLQEQLPDWVTTGPLGPVLEGLLRKDPAERMDAASVRELLERSTLSSAPATARLLSSKPRPNPEHTQALSLPPPAAVAAPAVEQSAPPFIEEPAPVSSPPPPPSSPPARRRHGVSLLVVGLVLVALLGLAGVLAILLGGGPEDDVAGNGTDGAASSQSTGDPGGTGGTGGTGDEPGSGGDTGTDTQTDGSEPTTEPQDTETTEPQDTETTEPQDTETTDPAEEETPEPGVAPAGYKVYEDPSYLVAVPKDWTVEVESETRTFFYDPVSRRYLLVEEGGEPNGDPVEDWENQEASVSQRLEGYQLIGIERADYRDFDAADWQFLWEPGGGTLQVLNRAVVDGDQAFALYWSVPLEEWEQSKPVFEDIAASFDPLG